MRTAFMYPAILTGGLAFVLGSMGLGVGVTALLVAWRWALARPGSAWRQLARAALGLASAAVVLVGLVLLTNGVETLAGSPLGRWSGSSMVADLWIALELWTRDLVITAALSRRRVAWIPAALAWVLAKAALVLTVYVVLWWSLGA